MAKSSTASRGTSSFLNDDRLPLPDALVERGSTALRRRWRFPYHPGVVNTLGKEIKDGKETNAQEFPRVCVGKFTPTSDESEVKWLSKEGLVYGQMEEDPRRPAE